ncbi:hypothetical protein [Bacillus wiedmannii]|uniref:hypothetical protein n=1 Tax=Bacillus wiedmannii TaxID=1890302 RepID=UPI001596B369|nr:hypothetical protein [Bacillus wiedmannii]
MEYIAIRNIGNNFTEGHIYKIERYPMMSYFINIAVDDNGENYNLSDMEVITCFKERK